MSLFLAFWRLFLVLAVITALSVVAWQGIVVSKFGIASVQQDRIA